MLEENRKHRAAIAKQQGNKARVYLGVLMYCNFALTDELDEAWHSDLCKVARVKQKQLCHCLYPIHLHLDIYIWTPKNHLLKYLDIN